MSTTSIPSRTLVLCFDGTAQEFTTKNTNVVKLFGLLEKDDQSRQLCYYQAGIGTYTNPGIISPIIKWFAMIADEAFAWYLDHHVMGGYQFLMENYQDGDKICLFGFSRGAYTARALAGMLYRVGLLSRGNIEQVSFAYKVYTSTGKKSDKQAELFKVMFSRPVWIEFVGCWETVSSTGILYSKQLPFTASTTAIKTFRHALALDEHRSRFQANVWQRTAPTKQATMLDPQRGSAVKGQKSSMPQCSPLSGESSAPVQRSPTDVLEVWFSGCHSDIGGGDHPNSDQVTLSDITLRWMVREVIKAQTGIIFNAHALREAGFTDEDFLVTSLLSANQTLDTAFAFTREGVLRTGAPAPSTKERPSQSEFNGDDTDKKDRRDSTTPISDPLKIRPLWWLVEILPFPVSWQDTKGLWQHKWRINFGRGRTIYDANPNFYITVKERMEGNALSYTPRAKYDSKAVVWRDA